MRKRSFASSLAFAFLATLVLPACTKQSAIIDTPATAATALLCIKPKPIVKPSFVIDQFNTDFPLPFYYNINYTPMGQEFTPSLHAMDAVELQFDDASCSLTATNGGSFKLRIRRNTIQGQIIGTSETIEFPNCFVGIKRFNFPAFIPVIPGERYVIEAVYVSGHTSSLFLNNYTSSYAGGRFILSGVTQEDKDLWFKEGLYNFIALKPEQAKNNGWKHLVRADGTPFKNQGDCIQYINNGH